LLQDNKFKAVLDLSKPQKKKYIKTEDHMAFLFQNLHVELHWEMTGFYLMKPVRFEQIQQKLTNIFILEKKIVNLSTENLLVYLCIHGSKDAWGNLEQVYSIAALLKKNKSLDWSFIKQRSKKWGCWQH